MAEYEGRWWVVIPGQPAHAVQVVMRNQPGVADSALLYCGALAATALLRSRVPVDDLCPECQNALRRNHG